MRKPKVCWFCSGAGWFHWDSANVMYRCAVCAGSGVTRTGEREP